MTLSLPLLAVLGNAQSTWIVDAAGGGQFTTLAAAFDAASAGDTLLVRSGVYMGFHRVAKGVRILGDGLVVVSGPIWLEWLPPGERLLLAGLRIEATWNPVAGQVSVGAGLLLEHCPNVVLTALDVRGPNGSVLSGGDGGHGISLFDSNAVVSGVSARGGAGNPAGTLGFVGGYGCHVEQGEVAFSACLFRAGDSGAGLLGWPQANPSMLAGPGSTVAVDATALAPATPSGPSLIAMQGRVVLANHVGGLFATAMTTSGGTIQYEGGPAVSGPGIVLRPQPGVVGPSSVAPGATGQWTVRGAAGSLGVAVASLDSAPLALPSLCDTTLFAATHSSSVLLDAVVVGPAGFTVVPFSVPNLPSLTDSFLFFQVAGWIGQPVWKASGVAVTWIR